MEDKKIKQIIVDANFDISNSLLHDVILLEVRAFVMKFEAAKKRKAKERTSNLESEIDKLQNSQKEEDILPRTIWKEKDQ